MKLSELLENKSAYSKLDDIALDRFSENFASLSENDMAELIDLKKADKIAEKEYGEFGFATLSEHEMEEVINNNPKLVKK